MVAKIFVKDITVPPRFRFHDVKQKSPEEIFKSGSYANRVAFNSWETGGYEGLLGHWCHCSFVIGVSEKVETSWRVIDFEVHPHHFFWITGTVLLCPIKAFPIDVAGFRYWNVDGCHF